MNTTGTSLEGATDFYQEIVALVRKRPRAWQSVGAVLGLAGGVLAPLLGAASDVATWFVDSHAVGSSLHALSAASCALTIPLLIVGGICLDSLAAKAPCAFSPRRGEVRGVAVQFAPPSGPRKTRGQVGRPPRRPTLWPRARRGSPRW